MAALAQKDWVNEIEKKVEHARRTNLSEQEDAKLWRKHTIYRVPPYMSGSKGSSYRPKMISFGPYHHDDEALQSMEQHKIRALQNFIARSNKHVVDYVKALDDVVEELMECYDQLPVKWQQNREEFLQLMLLDGCFMLEILYHNFNDYAKNDPIFSQHGMLHKILHIKRDMLLIENQLPLLVLETLISVGRDETEVQITFQCSTRQNKAIQEHESLYRLILNFCNPNANAIPNMQQGLHVLDVVRQSMVVGTRERRRSVHRSPNVNVRSATELEEAGVHFKRSRTNLLKDISFEKFWETLRLPVITIDDSTKFMFLNLMAFEQLHEGAGSDVTSYVFFMDSLIDTPKDVNLLRSKGIIINALGSDEAVAKLFNEISTDMAFEPNYSLSEIIWQMRTVFNHYNARWRKYRGDLMHTYFRSPWATISLAAACVLFILTVLQTTFTYLDYRKP